MKSLLKLAMALALLTPILKAQDTRLDAYLRAGKLQEGVAAFSQASTDGDRFSLAVLQSLQGLQQFANGAGELGLQRTLANSGLPFFRTAQHPPAAAAVQATPEKVAQLFQNLREALKKANATLAKVGDSDFKVQVNLSQAYLENKDGLPAMPLADSLGQILGLRTSSEQDLIVNFDSADAAWLKGYTHVLLGVLDIVMTYDWRPVWNQAAQVFFVSPDPLPPIAKYTLNNQGPGFSLWADLIAAVHEIRLEVIDPAGLRKAVAEFQSAIVCSRLCWKRVLAETDDDHEWLPSPKQTGPRGSRITQAEIDGWLAVLSEVDGILAGKKLLPHWRVITGVGINVPKLAQTPPKLDLVLFLQGSALVPYIEGGDVSGQLRWNTLLAPFDSGFTRFALWSN